MLCNIHDWHTRDLDIIVHSISQFPTTGIEKYHDNKFLIPFVSCVSNLDHMLQQCSIYAAHVKQNRFRRNKKVNNSVQDKTSKLLATNLPHLHMKSYQRAYEIPLKLA